MNTSLEDSKTEIKNEAMQFTEIQKRDGRVMPFEKDRVVSAIFRAMMSVGLHEFAHAEQYAEETIKELAATLKENEMPTVEGVQDIIEKVLLENSEVRCARAYISYRAARAALRKEKAQILEKETLDEVDKLFGLNALQVLKARYLEKDEKGHLIEWPKQLFERVAVHVALPTLLYDVIFFDKEKKQKIHEYESFDPVTYKDTLSLGHYTLNRFHMTALKTLYDRLNKENTMKCSWGEIISFVSEGKASFHELTIDRMGMIMKKKRFLPNTPALANFGRSLGMGSACFVLGLQDSMESIMGTLYNASFIFKAGGGVGYNFSALREEGAAVKSTSGVASGPLSFMALFDKMTEVIKQGGIRRGANMGILNSNHPDVEKFVIAKRGNGAFRNFNISVLLMDGFWEAYRNNENYPLVNSLTGETVRMLNARTLFNRIVYQAWESAEPGLIFYDRINEYNPLLEALGPIVTTNPCGEVLLYPNESCNLGSVNVHAFVRRHNGDPVAFDWEGLKETVKSAVEFLDNVIDVNRFPLPEIEAMTLATRKIGLGMMGLGDTLFALGIPYDSDEGFSFMERLAECINFASKEASLHLAETRGAFPLFEKSSYKKEQFPFAGFYDTGGKCDWKTFAREVKEKGIRNAYTTVIAPTGSLSMIAETSSGIEPVFSLVYEKNVSVGSFYYIDPEFEYGMQKFGVYDSELLKDIARSRGSLQELSYFPKSFKKIFKVAYDLSPEHHVRALASFQKWVDSSISKTINFPKTASVEDMEKVYLLAYELGCKGVTVYRDSSIENQVLSTPGGETKEPKPQALPTQCPQCSSALVRGEGCLKCPSCGWGLCAG